MPRPKLGPRLYLRSSHAGRAPVYVIRDGSDEISTGCGADRLAEAEQQLAAHIAAKYTPPTQRGAALADILIADVLASYLTEHAPTVAEPAFIRHTAAPVLDWWGAKTLADVRGQSCRDYVAWRTAQAVRSTAGRAGERRVTEATARHELKTLRAAIHYWHREYGPLPAVPVVTLPEAPEARERWLTRSEAARAIRAARSGRQKPHIVRLILIGLYTGTRPGAIRRLGWLPSTTGGWIDLDGGVIHRRGSGARRSKKRQPPIPIPDRLLPHLVRWHRADMIEGRAGGSRAARRPCHHVIHYYGRPVGKLRNSWRSTMADAGLGRDVTPHTLRHTATTWLMQAGVDIAEVAGFIGISIQILEDVYGHHHPDFQRAAASAERGRKRREQPGNGP